MVVDSQKILKMSEMSLFVVANFSQQGKSIGWLQYPQLYDVFTRPSTRL